jgi:DNA-3-methyladenine glycosylase
VPPEALGRDFFDRDVREAARAVLGSTLLVHGVGGVIVEVEAYAPDDPASHAYRGPTPRNAAMFGPPGHAYVYRSYGLHWCLNLVCQGLGSGAAVLVRALEPTHEVETMRMRRGAVGDRLLCAGPGRLTEALGVSGAHDGRALDAPPFTLLAPTAPVAVASGPRIGISQAADRPWRYVVAGSDFLSRPLRPRSPSPPTARRPG